MPNSYVIDQELVEQMLAATKEGMIRSQLQKHLDEIPMIPDPHHSPSSMVERVVQEVQGELATYGIEVTSYDVMLVWLTDLYFANMESN